MPKFRDYSEYKNYSEVEMIERSQKYFEEIEDYTKCQEVQQLISKISG